MEVQQETKNDVNQNPYMLIESSHHLPMDRETLDWLQSPRKWLEYWETVDGQEGAYTVMRCDYTHFTKNQWNLWGQSFHIERLVQSFRLLQVVSIDHSYPENLSLAINATYYLVKTLLDSASQSMELSQATSVSRTPDSTVTVMMTILWTPTQGQGIKVRGHAFHSGQLVLPNDYNPSPIVVSLARAHGDKGKGKEDHVLPNRYNDRPQVKRSSWCRRRTLLEDEFKLAEIGEVLLTRGEDGEEVELLEGLTSNLFIVYKDGSLRTASEASVLGGYARQLVLDGALKCGLRTQIGPLYLRERSEWKEIFTTSAIKVITPVAKVVMVRRQDDQSLTQDILWVQQSPSVDDELWRIIYSKILENNT